MGFNSNYKYFNKWFVIGTISGIDEQMRTQGERAGTSFGTQLTIQTGSPSGNVRVRIPNNKNMPNAHDAAVNAFEIGSRVAVGFGSPQWLRVEQRESNGKLYVNYTQFHLPELATVDQHNRAAGKLTGELIAKDIVDDHLEVTLELYDTDKDGNEQLSRDGQSQPHYFRLAARQGVMETLYDVPMNSNVELSVRQYNDLVRDDFGDVLDSINEMRVEKFVVHGQAQQAQAPFAPQQQQVQTPFHTMTTTQQQPSSPFSNPFAQQVPFPGVGQQTQANPFATGMGR